MKRCEMHLPGNRTCPHEPIYEITSPLPGGERLRRSVCLGHLVAAIDHDMRLVSGVRVRMTGWVSMPEKTLRQIDDGKIPGEGE